MNPHVNEPTHQHACSLSLSWFSEEPLTLIFSLTYLSLRKRTAKCDAIAISRIVSLLHGVTKTYLAVTCAQLLLLFTVIR